jgi:flagellar protein FliO/FliZ
MSPGAYFQFVAALAFVLALIAGCAWAVRRFGLFSQMAPKLGGKRRLSIVETLGLDAKRRLVLVRRDDKEHLVILGPASETVVEAGIAPPPDTNAGANAGVNAGADAPGLEAIQRR